MYLGRSISSRTRFPLFHARVTRVRWVLRAPAVAYPGKSAPFWPLVSASGSINAPSPFVESLGDVVSATKRTPKSVSS